MKFVEYGNRNGKPVVYFHGTPGAPEEASIFDAHAKAHNLRIICPDRFQPQDESGHKIPTTNLNDGYQQTLTSDITRYLNGKPFDLIGFSMGAKTALDVAALLGERAGDIHLVSPAAPITDPLQLKTMAGGIVFSLAKTAPTLLVLLSYWQKVMSALAPRALNKMLFANTAGRDKILTNQNEFQGYIQGILQHCFKANRKGYINDISRYVAWQEQPINHKNTVKIWHGSEDNWAPLAMAENLRSALTSPVALEVLEGASHYSCLFESCPLICKALAKV